MVFRIYYQVLVLVTNITQTCNYFEMASFAYY